MGATTTTVRAVLAAVPLVLVGCSPPEGGVESNASLPGSGHPSLAQVLEGRALLVERPGVLPFQGPEIFGAMVAQSSKVNELTYEYDPLSYVRRTPGIEYVDRGLPSYRAEGFRVATNEFGFREDVPVRVEKPELRVVVAGDSHTDGALENRDSYPNQLESLLARGMGQEQVEVLNAGVGYTTLTNYVGTLIKVLPLEPDVFVVGVYGGNDFGGLVELARRLGRVTGPRHDREYFQKLDAASRMDLRPSSSSAAIAQAYNQTWWLASDPGREDQALALALEHAAAIESICGKRGIRCIWLYVPSAFEVERARLDGISERLDRHFGLSPDQAAANARLGGRFVDGLRTAGCELVDAREVLISAVGAEPLYWPEDLHLSVAGCGAIAAALAQLLTTR